MIEVKSRTARCVKCKRTWYISIYTTLNKSGYTCPICKGITGEAMDDQIFIKKNGYALNAYL